MESSIRLIAFDLDGVLADTEDIHYHALIDAVRLNTFVSDEVISQCIVKDGTSTKSKLSVLKSFCVLDDKKIKRIDKDKQKLTLDELQQLQPNKTLLEMFDWLLHNNYFVALVSNSRPTNVHQILESLEITKYFPVIFTPTDELPPKPSQALYVSAIDFYDVSPLQTLVFEDSPAGIEAAVKSGAYVMPINTVEQVNLTTLQYAIDEANYINSHGGKRNQILKGRIQGH
jgi:beta-phosphoglucomutase